MAKSQIGQISGLFQGSGGGALRVQLTVFSYQLQLAVRGSGYYRVRGRSGRVYR